MEGDKKMATRNQRILVPEARAALNKLKGEVMKKKGYNVDQHTSHLAKYEVAEEKGIPLDKNYNGNIKAKDAGKIGGEIGGSMVSEMIEMAKKQLNERSKLT